MAWKLEKFDIEGTRPLIMHNGDLADPRNEYVKQLKPLTAKRNKTEETLIAIERLEFLGGLYYDGTHIIIPTRVIKKMILEAARKSRQGKLVESGVSCTQDAILKFPGPHDPKKLWENDQFHYRVMVVVNNARIPRMRPIFHEWSAVLAINYDTEVVIKDYLRQWVEVAGMYVGFGEQRPDFGRFKLV